MQQQKVYQKLSKILRTEEKVISGLAEEMKKITGLEGVIREVAEDNEWRVEKTLRRFGLRDGQPGANEVQEKLIYHINESEKRLLAYLNGGEEGDRVFNDFPVLIKKGLSLMRPAKLWVLKKDKAREILTQNPPPNILKVLGYKNGKELLEKEKLEEVFSALRFMESGDWMHKTFDEAYKNLTPDDFEEREVEVIVLDKKWLEAGREFVEKKRHNLSHLKELGIVFVIPITINKPGELMRVTALLYHYLVEVEFYSSLFRRAVEKEDFAQRIISLLKGEVLEKPVSVERGVQWLIVQRYLSKDDPKDKRLFVPHVNPEAIHWRKAEEALAKMDEKDISLTLSFWKDLDWVGGYFSQGGGEELVSFDLVDTTMSLVMQDQNRRFLYHQQEALWNKIFAEYLSEEQLENLIVRNLDKGYIHLK